MNRKGRREIVWKFYDNFAGEYDNDRYGSDEQKSVNESTRRVVMNLLGDVMSKSVLDCGCGTGRFAELFIGKQARVVGMDISTNMINIANNKVPSAEFVRGDVFKMPFKDGQFDIAICFQVLTHLHEYERPLLEMKRIIKDNGTIIIDIRNILSPFNFLYNLRQRVMYRGRKYYPHYTHIWHLKQICDRIGLDIVKFRGVSSLNKTINVDSRIGKYLAPTLVLKILAKDIFRVQR